MKSFNLQSKLSVGRTRGMDQNFDIRNLTISRDQNLGKGIEKNAFSRTSNILVYFVDIYVSHVQYPYCVMFFIFQTDPFSWAARCQYLGIHFLPFFKLCVFEIFCLFYTFLCILHKMQDAKAPLFRLFPLKLL